MKITKRQLRKLLLKEVQLISEQEDALNAVVDLNVETIKQLTQAYGTGGLAGLMGFAEKLLSMGAVNIGQLWQLATNDTLQKEMEAKFKSEGAEAAYVLWTSKLKDKLVK